MTDSSLLALLGGPESGKTTYLGALVDALEGERLPNVSLRALPADARAFEKLSEPLLEGHYPQRTKEERHVLDLPLRATHHGVAKDLTLTVGDYDGEEVERLFMNRTTGFSAEWRARADARGLLLFLRPSALTPLPTLRLRDALPDEARWAALRGAPAADEAAHQPGEPTARGPEQVFGPGLAEEATAPPPARPDDPVRVPTALAVIELLQFLRFARGLAPGERPPPGSFRIAVFISAWDAVDRKWQDQGPGRFLLEQAPLLNDFLWSNFHEEDVHCFGLSSTAGDLRNPQDRERYLEDPHGVVTWTDATSAPRSSRNLALPIAWILFGDRALANVAESGHS